MTTTTIRRGASATIAPTVPPRRVARRFALPLAVLFAATAPLAAPLAAQRTTPAVAPAATVRPDSSGMRPLSIDEALQIAETHSQAVRIAEAGVTRARGQLYEARSALFPQLNATGSYQRTIQSQFQSVAASSVTAPSPNAPVSVCAPRGATGGSSVDLTQARTCPVTDNPLTRIFASPNTIVLGLTGSQTLFAGGRLLAGSAAAVAGREAAQIGVVAARAQVQYDVAQAYYDAALTDRLVAIAESSLVQTERTYRQASLARQVGSTSEFELLRASVARDNQRPVVIQARSQRTVAYLRLRQLLDLPAATPLLLTTVLQDDAPEPNGGPLASAGGRDSARTNVVAVRSVNAPITADEVLASDPGLVASIDSAVARADTTTDARSAVRQAGESVRAQRSLLRAARGERLPSLSLSTGYQRYAYPANGIPTALNQLYPNWTVSLGVSVPIFSGGRVTGDILVAQANLIEAQQRFDQAREFAALDAQLAVADLAQADASWRASAGTAVQAARAYTIAQVRYQEGISTQVELSDSRILLQQAAANRAQAARNLQVARMRLSLLRDLPLQAAASASGSTQSSATGASSGGAAARQGTTQQQGQSQQQAQPQGTGTSASTAGN